MTDLFFWLILLFHKKMFIFSFKCLYFRTLDFLIRSVEIFRFVSFMVSWFISKAT